jgi:glutamyl-tRNA synthetase
MTVRVRIAPSPTGKLHVGNVRTALMNWLFAKQHGGVFMLRIDDTDLARSTKEFEAAIYEDFTWLGLHWQETAKQSERFARYDAARDHLIAKGLLYPCYETEEELDRKRKIAQATGKPPLYDRAALRLSKEDRAALEAEGRKPHWRFKLSGARVEWDDLVRGRQAIDTASQSDPVLIRADGDYLYTLPSVVDDLDFKMSHIIRGEDHVTNTGAQIEIMHALADLIDAPLPQFAHFPLLAAADGSKLSKRNGALSVEELREDGVEPIAILSHLAKIGTSDPVAPRPDVETLAAEFAWDKIGRAPARFDPEELVRVNAQVLHTAPYAAVKADLAHHGADLGEAFWLAVRANLARLRDAKLWADVVRGPITPVIADAGFAAAAAEVLPAGAYDAETWKSFTEAVKGKTGAKGKALFMPLRQALTGQDHGPEMGPLFALIGAEKARARLAGQAA